MMAILNKISVGGRVRLAFGALFVALLVVGGAGLYQTAQMHDIAQDTLKNRLPSVDYMGRIAVSAMSFRQTQAVMLLANSPEQKATIAQRRTAALDEFQAALHDFQPFVDPGEEAQTLFPAIHAAWNDYQAQSLRLDTATAKSAFDIYSVELYPAFAKLRATIAADIAYNNAMSKLGETQSAAAFARAIWVIGIGAAAGAVMVVALAIWIHRKVTARIVSLAAAMRQLSRRDYGFDLHGMTMPDEIGDMVRALDECRNGLKSADINAAAQAAEQEVKVQRAASLERLTQAFEIKVGQMVGQVSASAAELQATAESMTHTGRETAQQATNVAAAAEEASTNVQTVASAAEELAASIAEISRQLAQSARVANKAQEGAKRTDEVVKALAEGAQRIGEVVGLISSIAGQTNLLALNATIEAARAGDAGKGFAVVASEVKSLATQTARATENISQQIAQIQAATKVAVESIGGIGTTIGEISQIAANVAAAVEEQGAATQEIARNVQQAAIGTQEVTSNITSVSQGANTTGSAANQVLGAAGELSQRAEQLRREVGQYIAGVKAA